MTRTCVALLSGGLDSMLAIRLMQEQGIRVEALNFKTIFTCCQDDSARAAHRLGVRLTVLAQEDDYLDLIKNPRYGYGKGANPCVDCRIYMFRKAYRFMQEIGADFLISGEVIGQRPMSQKRRDLDVIARDAELEDLLLRPLSAKMLPPTLPEREGWVDRSKLCGFSGRSRKGLIALARKLGIDEIPTPSTGCTLTEPQFSRKVHDLLQHAPDSARWDFELIKIGRHFRFDETTKVVLGRNQTENAGLRYLYELPESRASAWLDPDSFVGPSAIVVGSDDDEVLAFAGGLILRYTRDAGAEPVVTVETATGRRQMAVAETIRSREAELITQTSYVRADGRAV